MHALLASPNACAPRTACMRACMHTRAVHAWGVHGASACAHVRSRLQVVYTITLHGVALQTQFRVINNDDKPFDFTGAL